MKAVIPAAGFGTRFLPATKAQPKPMAGGVVVFGRQHLLFDIPNGRLLCAV